MSDASHPLVCICIPTYNAAETIIETLTSILNQTYPNLLVKVVDNASTDETIDRVATFQDNRLRVFRNLVNIGGEGNFNRCIELAEGAYTAIYHSDDLYDPEIVQKQVRLLEECSSIGAVFTEGNIIDERGRIHGYLRAPYFERTSVGVLDFAGLFKSVLKHSNYLICPSAMIRTTIYQQEIGRWRAELFKSSSDLDVWLRIALKHQVAILCNPLINYRISDKQASHSMIRTRTSRSDFYSVIDYYLKLPEVRQNLDPEDFRNYRWLEHTDRAIRATNLVLSGQHQEARKLLVSVRLLDSLHMGISSTRGLYTMMALLSLKLAVILKIQKITGWFINRLRRLIRK